MASKNIPPKMGDVAFEIAMQVALLDCTISGQLADGEGGFCIVGGLYACIDPDWAVDSLKPGMYDPYKAVRGEFGLEISGLVEANDKGRPAAGRGQSSYDVPRRRARVRKEIRRQHDRNY
jgi:hypothetical protein